MLKAFLITFALILPCAHPCMIFAVGRNATIDGSTLVAHTDDAGGGAADLRLVRVPAMDYEDGALRPVYEFFSGYPRLVAQERGVHYQPLKGQNLTTPLGFIPQVKHTYAYFDQDYGMMNEVQLSIAESTCAARTVGWAKSVDYGYNLFGIAELSKVALERCDSARCAIKTMGDLAVKYGFYSEDSGNPARPGYADSAEALGISDRYGEVWIFHVLTGPNNASAVWAAQRVPDGHVAASANGFIIRTMDLNDTDNYMASDNVMSFAQEMGWWKPEDGPFDFTAAYVGTSTPLYALYVGRRLWRIYDLFAPSLNLDSRLGFIPEVETYPFSVKPDKLVEIPQLMSIMRDHYEGTEYDMSQGLAAGPFNNPIRYDGPAYGVVGGWERPISIYRAAFSFVLQSRQFLPDEIGGVAWYGQDAPHGTAYVPFYCGQSEIPESYLIGKQSQFNQDSAWWAFNFVNNWSQLRFSSMKEDVAAKQQAFEKEAFEMQKSIEEKALEMYKAGGNGTIDYLQSRTNEFANRVVDGWWKLAWYLVGKYSDGYIVTGERPQDMKTPGYSKWWLSLTEFNGWPHQSFVPPAGSNYATVSSTNHSAKGSHTTTILFVCIAALGVLSIGAVTWYIKRKRVGYTKL